MRRRNVALALLSLAAGAVDALTFLTFQVFTSAMSGNTVLLGIALGHHQEAAVRAPALAFVGYALGVAGGTLMAGKGGHPSLRGALALETVLLGGFTALRWLSSGSDVAAIMLASLGMGVQGATAPHLRVPGVNTVVFTTTLTTVVGALARAALGFAPRRVAPETWLQIAAFACAVVGAALAAGLLQLTPAAAVIPAACALACLLVVWPGITSANPPA